MMTYLVVLEDPHMRDLPSPFILQTKKGSKSDQPLNSSDAIFVDRLSATARARNQVPSRVPLRATREVFPGMPYYLHSSLLLAPDNDLLPEFQMFCRQLLSRASFAVRLVRVSAGWIALGLRQSGRPRVPFFVVPSFCLGEV